jgi:amino acid transporter
MTTETLADAPGTHSLRPNALGTWGIVFMVISAAAPLTIVAGVAPLAILIGGVSAPLVYTFAGIVLAIFAIAFMAMTRHVKALGGFYTYITIALGKAVGLGSSFLALLSYNALQIGLYGLLGVSAQALVAQAGVDIPWWVFALVAVAAVFLVAWRGIDVGARVLAVLLIAESVILLLFAFSVLFHGGAEGITFGTFAPSSIFSPGMLAIVGIGFAAFMGFESTALYREEARNPNRTIPRATYIAVAFMAVFYGFVIWTVVLGAGESHVQALAGSHTETLVFDLIGRYLGPWAETATYVLILTSVYASQLAFHNAINRYTFSLARDGALPRVLQRTDAKTGSPWASGLLQTILAVIVVAAFALTKADPYLQLLLWVNSPGVIGIIALQILTCAAVVVFFVRRRDLARRWYVLPAAVVSGVLMIGVLVMLISQMDLLTAGGPVVNGVLLVLTSLPFVVGVVLALVWKRTRPGVYARIGGATVASDLADGSEPAPTVPATAGD